MIQGSLSFMDDFIFWNNIAPYRYVQGVGNQFPSCSAANGKLEETRNSPEPTTANWRRSDVEEGRVAWENDYGGKKVGEINLFYQTSDSTLQFWTIMLSAKLTLYFRAISVGCRTI